MTVEKLVYGGEGLSRLDGQVVLAPFTLPGERVRLEITGERTQYMKGRLGEILEASAERVAAPCPHFGACGGCHYQHAGYESQLEYKAAILREALSRIGKFRPPERIEVIAGPPLGYRNRAQFHLGDGRIGYQEWASSRLHPVEQCAVCSPGLHQNFQILRRMLGDRRFPRFLRAVELFTNETEVQLNVQAADQPVARRFFDWCAAEMPGLVPGALDYPAAGFLFRVSRSAFFQVNRFLLDRLVESALEGAQGETAVDLYSGVGLFALPLARRFCPVTAAESRIAAWRDLEFNAQRAGVPITALQTSAENFLRNLASPADFVIADPPRAGLGKQVVESLLQLPPRRLTIVSCNPATLARDLAALLGRYEIDSMTLIDLFPQTYHLETIARLRLASAS